jgi:hypothetical protein
VTLPPVSNRRVVDFGAGVGRRAVYLYSLPEVASGRQVFGVPSISARFGTDPEVWNWAMWLMARLVPKSECPDLLHACTRHARARGVHMLAGGPPIMKRLPPRG